MINNRMSMTLGSLFDGIGGFPYAGSFYGIEPVWASEILPQAVSVTMRHFPGMAHVGDITKLDGAKLPSVDIITFGSPCQDLSTAGKRAGLSGERSGLFAEAMRIIFEMRRATNGIYPRYALWENVPGAMSSAGGRDFQSVLEAFTKTQIPMPASGRWANSGMVRGNGVDLAWRVLNAQYFGVPQRRRRIFLITDFGGASAGEILFVEEGMRWHTAPGGEARQETAADAQRCAGDAGGVAFACNQRDEVRDLHDVSAAICASQTMKQQTFIARDAACLNPWDTQQSRVFTEDCASPTLAGADGGGGRNPAGLVFCSASSQSHAGITEELAGTLTCQHEQPFICEPELARTLTARGDSSPCADRGQNVVAVNMPAVSVHQNGNGDLSTSETAKSLTTIGTASCRNAPLVAHPDITGTLCASGAGLSRPAGMASDPDLCVAYALQGNMIGRQDHNGPNGSGINEDLSFTLTATDTPAVASAIPIHDRATRFQGGGSTRSDDGSGNGLGVGKAGDPAPTLTSGDHHAAAIPINTQTAMRHNALGEGTGFGVGTDKDPAFTLQQAHCHAVAAVDCRNYKEVGNISGTLQAKDKPGYSLNYQNPVRAGYIVRRLTPTECERLQGFSDGWTRFGHDNKEISDTRRYQMLGNSVAVPCVKFILSGIAGQLLQDRKEAA